MSGLITRTICTLALLASPVLACAQVGASGFALLKIGSSAQGAAMGDAMTAVVSGASSTTYNPAGLAPRGETATSQIQFTHREWVADTRIEYLMAAVNLDGSSSLGFSLYSAATSDIEIRTRPGSPEGTFTARSFHVGASYARTMGTDLAVGASIHYLYEKLLIDDAAGFSVDAGARWQSPLAGLSAGAALVNVGSMEAMRKERTTLPATALAGAAYEAQIASVSGTATLAGDLGYRFAEERVFGRLGGEMFFDHVLAVRAGYQLGSAARGWSAGLGIRYSIVLLDYAFAPLSEDLGNTHTLTLGVTF